MQGWNKGLSDDASERQNRQKSAPDPSESIIVFNPVWLVEKEKDKDKVDKDLNRLQNSDCRNIKCSKHSPRHK